MNRYRLMPTYRYHKIEGAPYLALGKTAGKPLRDYKVYGNCGKNLIDVQKALDYRHITTDYKFSYFKFKNGKTYTMSCVSKIEKDGAFLVIGSAATSNYAQSQLILNALGEKSVTFTVPSDGADYYLKLYYDGTPNYVQHDNFFNGTYLENLQIEYGSAATEYEPYQPFGDLQPDGKYKIPIVTSGVNLIDYTQIKGGTVSYIDGGLELTSYANATGITPEKFLEMTGLKEGDKVVYTCDWEMLSGKWDSNSHWKGCILFLTKTSGYSNLQLSNADSITRTIPEGFNSTNYQAANIYGGKTADDGTLPLVHVTKMLLQRADVVTEYEPYIKPITTDVNIDYPLDETDYIDFINGKIVKGTEETAIDLPYIPTAKGNTVVSVNTKIPSSNMTVEYYK